MSADSYSVCPRCAFLAKKARAKALESAEKAYGQVPADAYRRMILEAEAMPEVPKVHDLEEYYSFDIDLAGVFTVKYHCGCRKCGFEHKFEAQQACPVERIEDDK